MAQEFTINSSNIESKINQLLPSQGGFGAGVDFSASTMVIPIVDLTETAEGSPLRQDLQTSFSLKNITTFSVANTTSNLVSTTGYYRVFGNVIQSAGSSVLSANFKLTDGFTSKSIISFKTGLVNSVYYAPMQYYDFNVFLEAGDTLQCTSNSSDIVATGITRQIATVTGDLV
jgi:hypothetical protein